MFSSTNNCRRRYALWASVIGCVAIPQRSARGEDSIVTERGTKLAIDSREFVTHLQPTVEEHLGNVRLERQAFVVKGEPPRIPFVEVTHLPSDYRFGLHDMVGMLRHAATADQRSRSQRSGPMPEPVIESLGWIAGGSAIRQRICYASMAPDGTSGVVAWYDGSSASNGRATIRIAYRDLQGLPRDIIDRYLQEYPSDVKPEDLVGDWVDKDLEKWIEILRSVPTDDRMLEIVFNGLMEYQRQDGRDWGISELASKKPVGPTRRAKCEEVASRVEEWRRLRKSDR